MNRGSSRVAKWAEFPLSSFNEAPIHESGKFASLKLRENPKS